jgi:hypothetical protein
MTDGYELRAYGVSLIGVEVSGFEGRGVRCGDHSVIRDGYFHDNRQNGIGCFADSEAWHVQILNNRIMYNGSKVLDYNSSGGVKLLNLARPTACLGCGATVSGNVSAHNHGNGIWFDQSSSGIVANNNTTFDNTHFGIRCEKCAGPVSWIGNTSYNNAFADYSLRNVAVATLQNNTAYGSDIGLVVTYAAKDDKTYPNLGDPHLGYHPYRILIEDIAKIRDGISHNSCSIRNVTCRA